MSLSFACSRAPGHTSRLALKRSLAKRTVATECTHLALRLRRRATKEWGVCETAHFGNQLGRASDRGGACVCGYACQNGRFMSANFVSVGSVADRYVGKKTKGGRREGAREQRTLAKKMQPAWAFETCGYDDHKAFNIVCRSLLLAASPVATWEGVRQHPRRRRRRRASARLRRRRAHRDHK
jgi:hypothetical protein